MTVSNTPIREFIASRKLKVPWTYADGEFDVLYKDYILGSAGPSRTRSGTITRSILSDLPEFSPANTRIGIEIECEGLAGIADYWKNPLWQVKGDGSLRNGGIEFISPALKPEQVRRALAAVMGSIYSYKKTPDFSWRTSIHVHLECIHLLVREFKALMLLDVVFEEALFQFANPGRRDTNIFCTPITRSHFYSLGDFINADSPDALVQTFAYLNKDIEKYSALNINHMYDFGTVEFRHLRGTGDHRLLHTWISILLKMFSAAQKVTTEELYEDIQSLNTTSAYGAFTEKIFGEGIARALFNPNNATFLSRGVSLAKEVISGNALLKDVQVSPNGGLANYFDLWKNQRKKDALKTREARIRKGVV